MEIKQILVGIGCPVERPPYKFDDKTRQFVTYQLISETGDLFVEDDNDVERVLMSVDVYSRTDWRELVKIIKRRLKAADYSIISVGPELYEPDTKFYHIPLRVETIDAIDEDMD